jgi:nonsense-mediated mRNA decay protein 3
MCLKRIKGLEKVHLVDANFVWTEPHSKRVKVKLTIQKEVLGSTILEQVFVVEFTVHNQMCDDCRRQEASDYWKAVVQVRQRTNEKKTLFYVEQLILKHNAHANTLRIKEQHGRSKEVHSLLRAL